MVENIYRRIADEKEINEKDKKNEEKLNEIKIYKE